MDDIKVRGDKSSPLVHSVLEFHPGIFDWGKPDDQKPEHQGLKGHGSPRVPGSSNFISFCGFFLATERIRTRKMSRAAEPIIQLVRIKGLRDVLMKLWERR
mmetsp:Transcript_13612/g.19623  ORF Transcript_13612/g.19623 Transcript_13612/m.19623 type:complete len:101 (+) Transcript_13612:104-406(+)